MKQSELKASSKKRGVKPSPFLSEFDHPAEVALYFGFQSLKTPSIDKEDLSVAKAYGENPEEKDAWCAHADEKGALMHLYQRENFSSLPHPILIEYKRPFSGGAAKRHGMTELGLDIIGLSAPVAEAISIRTACSILEDEGYENLELRVNSLGDKDSIAEFERHLQIYLRKNGANMPADLRKALRQDIFALTKSTDEKWRKWKEEAPKSMNYLTESSREHLKEVLEFIEALGFSYTVGFDLIGNPKLCSHTIFEIVSEGNSGPVTLAQGYRYGRISKRCGLKRELPALTINLSYKPLKAPKKRLTKGLTRPKFYLVQIGYLAKLKTLNIIESLRRARIPVIHSVAKDKLTSQVAVAENSKTSHLILIGQKEALEDAVVVRDNTTRVQVTVPISELADYLKKLK
jgi:histidyl-tRNA synthetase